MEQARPGLPGKSRAAVTAVTQAEVTRPEEEVTEEAESSSSSW
ncbi:MULTISPECIES: hypothetical protein [unclassified Rhizobium]|nr:MULTISPECIES: hypothetical protein [unclassified Rhizobium]